MTLTVKHEYQHTYKVGWKGLIGAFVGRPRSGNWTLVMAGHIMANGNGYLKHTDEEAVYQLLNVALRP